MKRAILVGPIDSKSVGNLLKKHAVNLASDFVIGIDGGTATLISVGIQPHLAVGDWDSLVDPSLLELVPHRTLPGDKDRSDLHYALEEAIAARVQEIHAFGVTGGRPDHQLAMILDLAEAAAKRGTRLKRVCAHGPDAEYEWLSPRIPRFRSELIAGQTISILPIGSSARGVTITGVRYPLRNAVLTASSHGLSNAASGGGLLVRLRTGRLIVIIPYNVQ